MKAVIQRVTEASVRVDGVEIGACGKGYMILFCACSGDTEEDLTTLARKVASLRIFCDEEEKMNLSLADINGEVLCISQFTLAADTKKGNRPSFMNAMEPTAAKAYYLRFCQLLRDAGIKKVAEGSFGADMKVSLVNDGPVTIILDTEIWCKHER